MSIRVESLETMDFTDVTAPGEDLIPPTHPGDILRHEFMEPLNMNATALAGKLHVPTNRVTGVLNGTRRVTADTALRLARFFGTTAQFWLGLQDKHDLAVALDRKSASIRREVEPYVAHSG